MTIEVYPSLLPGEPIESHKWEGSIGAWLTSKGIDYLAAEVQPVSVSICGITIPVEQWDSTIVGDQVAEIRPYQHGGIDLIWAAVIALAASAAVLIFMPRYRAPNQSNTPQGRTLDLVSAKANQPRLGEIVPEIAGRHKRYPDYLTLPRRYFTGLREQWLEFLCCVGPGSYQILPQDVRIGETEIGLLGANASYSLFGPGASVASVTAHENWHTAPEVGGTSSGTAGLELGVDMASKDHAPAGSYVFSGSTISIPAGQGSYPVGWGNGTIVSVSLPLSYSVTREQEGPWDNPYIVNKFTGFLGHLRPIANNDIITVSGGGLSGQYRARSISIGSDGNGSLQLYTVGGTGDPPSSPQPVGSVTAGTHTLTFRGRNFTVSAVSSDSLSLYDATFPAMTSSAARIAFVGGNVYGEWTSAFAACPPAERTSTMEIDFFFPSGLARIDDNGNLQNRSVQIEIQYRDLNAGTPAVSILKTYTQATLDQIGFTERFNVPGIRPEVKVRRVSATSTSTQVQDKVQWYGLKSRLPTRTSYPGWTAMSIRIRSGGKLGAQSENQVNVIATRILPELGANGAWSVPQPTRDIASFARYIATTIGYTDADLDMGEFTRLNAIWKARADNFDFIFDQTTVKEALSDCFKAGMAELTIDEGLIKPVRDEPRQYFEQAYSPQNMTGPLTRTFRNRSIDDFDGVEVEFINAATWSKETVQCRLTGDQGFKVEKIKVDGVTDRTRAWRIGMRRRRQQRYINWEYQFETELDALNSGYLSYVPLIDDIPGYGQSALLEDIEATPTGSILWVTEPLKWEEGKSHVVAFRKPDGSLAGPFPATRGDDDYSLSASIFDRPIVTLKREPTHVYFGTSERWTFPALITEIAPDGLEKVKVSAVNYDERVYADDNNSPV